MALHAEREQLLEAAEELFYERGYHAVGMDTLRAASGLPLKRIYSLFPGKDAIAVEMLDRRDERWHASLAHHVESLSSTATPPERVLAVFDWLFDWLSSAGHRGCAWINAFGELGASTPEVADAVRRHKLRLRTYIAQLVSAAGSSPQTADAVFLLIEGSLVTAGISGDAEAARHAQAAAAKLLGC